jgi:nucleotide-binding universal stress UspA family protein
MTPERRIVVGVDGSDASVAALRWAVQQAISTGATLEVICAWESPNTPELTPLFGVPSVTHQPATSELARDSAQHRLDQVIDATIGAEGEVQVAARVIEGHPAPVLVQAAQGAILLVVGSSGHGAFVGMLLGSVTSHVTAHAPCPVVVVRG